MMRTEVAEMEPARAQRLDELYVRHHPWAVGLAFLLTGDRDEAADLAQEAFVRLAGRFQHLRNPDAFGAYLRRTIVNLHASSLRRRRLERLDAARRAARPAESAVQPDVAVRQDVWRALLELPPRQRAALVLRYYEDMSERDAAEALGCSLAALKSTTARAMQSLRDRVEVNDDA
ncbi:MAG: SigE family RNA polymerase sigma factor [Actinomycetota bacterium]